MVTSETFRWKKVWHERVTSRGEMSSSNVSFPGREKAKCVWRAGGRVDSKASSLHKALSHVLFLWKIRLEALEVSPQTAPPLPAALIFSCCNKNHSLLLVWVQHTLSAVLNASLLPWAHVLPLSSSPSDSPCSKLKDIKTCWVSSTGIPKHQWTSLLWKGISLSLFVPRLWSYWTWSWKAPAPAPTHFSTSRNKRVLSSKGKENMPLVSQVDSGIPSSQERHHSCTFKTEQQGGGFFSGTDFFFNIDFSPPWLWVKWF